MFRFTSKDLYLQFQTADDRVNKKEEGPSQTKFKVYVIMGNREQSPGSLEYLVKADAIGGASELTRTNKQTHMSLVYN